MKRAVLAWMLAVGAVAAAAQTMYRWTDEKGRLHVTGTPPPAADDRLTEGGWLQASNQGRAAIARAGLGSKAGARRGAARPVCAGLSAATTGPEDDEEVTSGSADPRPDHLPWPPPS